MPKTKKGKNRLDKFYHMAKEYGYRSRASFKLIQLNKKFNFLANAKVLIDLCAAPGSWLQVAAKYMPAERIIVGVDLDTIKPIPNVFSLQEDITTPKCRTEIKKIVKEWPADVVLHDGAPNVGSQWNKDAFGQAELVLMALKLATEFLRPNGTFVTKVFRSAEYNKLLWVLNQFFQSVTSTKPAASRAASAEIFVVCRGYLAPKKIDPRMLDSRFVFKEVKVETSELEQEKKLFANKQKRHRTGYEDGRMLLYKTISAREFVETEEPLKVLTEFNKIHFDDEESQELTKRKQTTKELISCLEDLKVLGKKEFKKILKWRVKMRELEHLDSSSSEEEEEPAAPLTEEEKAEQLNQEISAKLAEQEKLKRKKERKKKRLREKLKKKLGLSLLQDAAPYEGENPTDTEALFNLKQVKTNKVLQNLTTESTPMDVEEDEESEESESDYDSDEDEGERYNRELESALDGMYRRYLEASRSRRKRMTEEMRKMQAEDGEDMEDMLGAETLGQYDPEEDEEAKKGNPLIVREPQENKSKVWFSNILHNLSGMKGKKLSDILDDEREEDEEVKRMALEYKQEKDSKKPRGQKRKLDEVAEETNGHSESTVGPAAKKLKTGQQTAVVSKTARVTKVTKGDFSDMPSLEPVGTAFKAISRKAALKERTKSTPKTAETTADDVNTLAAAQQFEEYYKQQMAKDNGSVTKKGKKNEVTFEEVPAAMSGEEDSIEDDDEGDSMNSADSDDKAEVLALGHALKFGGTRRRQELMDATYTGRNFNFGDAAPAWFIEEDTIHNQPNIPITKDEVQMYKDQLKGINARTIKKVLEAQARKKKRESAKVAKAKAQARVIMQSEDITDKDKAKQLQKLFAKSGKGKTKVNNVYVVSKQNGTANMPNRRKGYRVKIVDPRLKKDKRSEANAQRKKGFKVKGATKEQRKAAKKYSRR
jgi:AdoMet-dependent rRNA methyltransferase SPB1